MIAALCVLLASTAAFDAGIEAYENGDVSAAAAAFEKAIESGATDSATLYNYGNALARADRLPEALAAYRSAQLRAPRDPDIRHNLDIVREKLDQPEPGIATRSLASVRLRELMWILAALAIAFAVSAVGYGWRGTRRWRAGTWLSAGLLLATSLLFVGRARIDQTPRAVILTSTPAQSDPSAGGATLFTIPPGTEVEMDHRTGDWAAIRIHRRDVWVRAGSLQPLW